MGSWECAFLDYGNKRGPQSAIPKSIIHPMENVSSNGHFYIYFRAVAYMYTSYPLFFHFFFRRCYFFYVYCAFLHVRSWWRPASTQKNCIRYFIYGVNRIWNMLVVYLHGRHLYATSTNFVVSGQGSLLVRADAVNLQWLFFWHASTTNWSREYWNERMFRNKFWMIKRIGDWFGGLTLENRNLR